MLEILQWLPLPDTLQQTTTVDTMKGPGKPRKGGPAGKGGALMWVVRKRFSEEAELKLRLAGGERPCRRTVGRRSIPEGTV